MNTFGVLDFSEKVGDFVKQTFFGTMDPDVSPSPPNVSMIESTSSGGIRPMTLPIANENHFADKDVTFLCANSEPELELAIDKCKQLILESEERSDRRYNLIKKLIELRWKLQEIRHGPQTPIIDESVTVMGHVFVSCNLDESDSYCEKCCTRIWDFVRVWPYRYFTCQKCRYKCHESCLDKVTRRCAYLKPHEYQMEICPESGLSSQKFKCFECSTSLMSAGMKLLPLMDAARRLCDSCGHWFCSYCHWNTEMIIPARVIHNWDFTPRKVCRSCVQFLRLMSKRPLLDVEKLNPYLFTHVEELYTVKLLREDLLQMKKFLTSCHIAQQKRLLWLLKKRHHFVENSHLYSLQDLQDLEGGTLLKYIRQVSKVFEAHITKECESCLGKGFYCELCSSKDLIFPLDRDIFSRCPDCYAVFHKKCFRQRKGFCPRCDRMSRRSPQVHAEE